MAVRLCLKLTGGSLAGTVNILVLTQCSTGNGSQTQMKQFASCMHFFAGCDICHGKNGRHCPGIQYKSSLKSFWKWWHLVLKQETVGLNKDIAVKVNDVSTQFMFCFGVREGGVETA